MPDFLQALLPSILSTTAVIGVAAFILRNIFLHGLSRSLEQLKGEQAKERSLEAEQLRGALARERSLETERLKSDLYRERSREIEAYKQALAVDQSKIELILQSKITFMEQQLGQLYWPIYSRLQKDNAIWDFLQRYRNMKTYDPALIRSIEMDTILPNHKEVVRILESHLHLAQADAELIELSQKYIRHVAVFQAMRAHEWREDPKDLGEPWPYAFFEKIERETQARQTAYETLLEEAHALKKAEPHPDSNP